MARSSQEIIERFIGNLAAQLAIVTAEKEALVEECASLAAQLATRNDRLAQMSPEPSEEAHDG